MKTLCEKPILRRLLDHFSAVTDPRERWRVAYPLPEVLLLVVCGTIASCDDYDDIVDWGEAHLAFLRRFLPYHHGVPCADWLRTLMNRVDPEVFSDRKSTRLNSSHANISYAVFCLKKKIYYLDW